MATITSTSTNEYERLRRAAASAEQGPTAEQQAHAYPRGEALEYLGDPQDPTNVTFPFLRRMRRDHMVAMNLHFIMMPIVSAPWYFEADDARVAAFADNLIRPIYGHTVLVALRMLWAGYSPAVKNFELVNPTWTYMPGINDDPKQVWDQGSIDALVYKPMTELKPENAKPVFDRSGNFHGIGYDGSFGGVGYFVIGGERKPNVDLLHSFWATHDKEGSDGSPYGFPRIAYAAPIFHMYRYIWTLLGRAFENNADPGPVVRYPREELPTTDADGKLVKNVDVALRIGRRRRSGSTVALPSDPYTDIQDKPTGKYKWDVEYPKSETNFSEIMDFLGFLETAKCRALFLQEQGLIEGSGGQSNRNVASEFGQQRDDSQFVLLTQIFSTIVDSMVKPALAMNMPWYQGKLEMKTVGFSSQEDEVARQILQLAGQEDYRNFGVDVRRLLDSRGMPMLSHADYKKVREEAATKPTAPPAVEPTQGRRAHVTQTGFDRRAGLPEMSYVQVPDRIELAADGDFVASLPKTDAFADKQVLSATRTLRNDSQSFLAYLYADFARFIAKQKGLDLAELAQAVENEHFDRTGEQLAAATKVSRMVDSIIALWRPKSDRIAEFSTKARSLLGRVYDRTASVHLERLSSTVNASSKDDVAAAWLDERGAQLVTGVMETTTRQIAEVLAEGVREGKSTKEIAADLRQHFDGFPATRAATIARTEISQAYNYATATTGIAAGVKKGQLLDGNSDGACKKRNGRIVSLSDALKEKLSHPNCTLTIRLLPAVSDSFAVRYEPLDDQLEARYDIDTETVLFSPDISPDGEVAYLLALGEALAPNHDAEEMVIA